MGYDARPNLLFCLGYYPDSTRGGTQIRVKRRKEKTMANAYTSPEAAIVEKRRWGQKLTLAGAVIAGFGILGIVLATVLKITWVLGFLGGPLGGVAWLAVLVGGGLFVYGFLQIKSAHENRPL